MGIEAIRSDLQREKFRLSRLAVAPVSAKADLELQSRLRVLKIRELPRAYWVPRHAWTDHKRLEHPESKQPNCHGRREESNPFLNQVVTGDRCHEEQDVENCNRSVSRCAGW
jgi:hypothetical protein